MNLPVVTEETLAGLRRDTLGSNDSELNVAFLLNRLQKLRGDLTRENPHLMEEVKKLFERHRNDYGAASAGALMFAMDYLLAIVDAQLGSDRLKAETGL